MASLSFPVKVWVLPAATPGTTANPVLNITVAIQTCNIRKRDINPPPVLRSGYWMRPSRNTHLLFDLENAQHCACATRPANVGTSLPINRDLTPGAAQSKIRLMPTVPLIMYSAFGDHVHGAASPSNRDF